MQLLRNEIARGRETARQGSGVITRGTVVSTRVEGSVGADRDAKLEVSWNSVVRSGGVDEFQHVGTPISFEEHRLGYELAAVRIIEGGDYAAVPDLRILTGEQTYGPQGSRRRSPMALSPR